MSLHVQLHCGDPDYLKRSLGALSESGICASTTTALHLLLDEPIGWASLEYPGLPVTQCIFVSRNRCPTYLLDLLKLEPAALVVLTPWCAETLSSVLNLVRLGRTMSPRVWTPLSRVERHTVRLVAQDHTNKEIARLRGVSEGAVKNTLSAAYRKLNLSSRMQLTHYYFGSWHLLRNWVPPRHVNYTMTKVIPHHDRGRLDNA